MHRPGLFAALSLIWCMPWGFAAGVHAADRIGEGRVGDRDAVLYSDGTWGYANRTAISTSAPCNADALLQSEVVPVGLCFDPESWKRSTREANDFEVVFQSRNGLLWAGLITEPIPLGIETLRNAILENTKAVATGGVRDVAETDLAARPGGHELRLIEYTVAIQDTPFRFANAYGSLPEDGAFQVVFWTVDTVYPRTANLRATVIETIHLTR